LPEGEFSRSVQGVLVQATRDAQRVALVSHRRILCDDPNDIRAGHGVIDLDVFDVITFVERYAAQIDVIEKRVAFER
jgi:hypothetical protein